MGLEPIRIDIPQEAPPEVTLTGRQKAALIVRLLAREGEGIPLQRLPDAIQADLIREVGALGDVDDAVTAAVVDEFAALLDAAGMYGPGGVHRALELLGGSVSPAVAEHIRAKAGAEDGDDPWDRIAEKDAARLAEVIGAESTEVGAVILSKLSVPKAAEVLGALPGPLARRITYGMSLTSGVAPAVIATIGRALAPALDLRPVNAYTAGPVERVGAILNFSRSAIRNDVLDGLDEDDKSFADEVRMAIFTFANIPERVEARDIPKVLREVEQDVVVRALASDDEEYAAARDFILGSVSNRMADALREEVADLAHVDDVAAEEAMGQIVAAVRRLEEAGDIYFVAQAGQGEDAAPAAAL